MSDVTNPTLGSILNSFRRTEDRVQDGVEDRFVAAALERNKREGLILAVKARWSALAVIGILLPLLNQTWEQLYYEAILVLFALIGWAQMRYGRVGKSRIELFLMLPHAGLDELAMKGKLATIGREAGASARARAAE